MIQMSSLVTTCCLRWLETEFDDSVMEKFVLVPEMSPISSMKSAVVPTFLPALSEVCSLAVLAGGGGGVVAAANPLAVAESGTARVSVLPDVGSELPTVYVGNGALGVVSLRVGQSCLRMDSEETLPALQDERSMMSFLVRPAAVLISIFFCRMMSLVRTDPHLWYMLVGLSSVTWTLTPYGWYHGTTAGPLRPGLILEFLSGEA